MLNLASIAEAPAARKHINAKKVISMELKVEVEGIKHSGVTKGNKPYFILSCYVLLPGLRHPQACDLFSDKALNSGTYDVPCAFSIKENRPAFELKLSEARLSKVGQAA